MTLKPLGSKQDWMSIFSNKHLSGGCKGLPSFQEMVDFTMQHWKQIGITDEDVAELAARKQCYIGAFFRFAEWYSCSIQCLLSTH